MILFRIDCKQNSGKLDLGSPIFCFINQFESVTASLSTSVVLTRQCDSDDARDPVTMTQTGPVSWGVSRGVTAWQWQYRAVSPLWSHTQCHEPRHNTRASLTCWTTTIASYFQFANGDYLDNFSKAKTRIIKLFIISSIYVITVLISLAHHKNNSV